MAPVFLMISVIQIFTHVSKINIYFLSWFFNSRLRSFNQEQKTSKLIKTQHHGIICSSKEAFFDGYESNCVLGQATVFPLLYTYLGFWFSVNNQDFLFPNLPNNQSIFFKFLWIAIYCPGCKSELTQWAFGREEKNV